MQIDRYLSKTILPWAPRVELNYIDRVDELYSIEDLPLVYNVQAMSKHRLKREVNDECYLQNKTAFT